jgi:hypothetical protein
MQASGELQAAQVDTLTSPTSNAPNNQIHDATHRHNTDSRISAFCRLPTSLRLLNVVKATTSATTLKTVNQEKVCAEVRRRARRKMPAQAFL